MAAKAITILANIAILWLAAAILPQAEFGMFMLALTIITTFGLLAASPFFSIVVYKVALLGIGFDSVAARRIGGQVFWCSVVAGGLMSLTLWTLAEPVSMIFRQPTLEPWIKFLSPLVFTEVSRMSLTQWYRARQRVSTMTLYQEIIPTVLRVLALGLIWRLGGTHADIALGYFLASFTPLVLLYFKEPLGLYWGQRVFTRADLIYAFENMGARIATEPARSFDIMLIGLVAGPAVVAHYALASRLARVLLIPFQALGQLAMPRLGSLLGQEKHQQAQEEYHALRLICYGLAIAGCAAAIALGPVILPLFGDYGAAYPILVLLCLAHTAATAFGFSSYYLSVSGHARVAMHAGLFSSLTLFALFYPLTSAFGAEGMAIAMLLMFLIMNGLMLKQLRDVHNFKIMNEQLWLSLAGVIVACQLTAFDMIPWFGGAPILVVITAAVLWCSRTHVMSLRREIAA